jgi:hypothetical protein
MRVFNGDEDGFDAKVNFVDENNVFLGYDIYEMCCEYAGWFIDDVPHSSGEIPSPLPQPKDFPGWVFDTAYFSCVHGDRLDDGGMAIFRIVKGEEEKFVHLFNCHNGYYGHGFDFKIGEETIRQGGL